MGLKLDQRLRHMFFTYTGGDEASSPPTSPQPPARPARALGRPRPRRAVRRAVAAPAPARAAAPRIRAARADPGARGRGPRGHRQPLPPPAGARGRRARTLRVERRPSGARQADLRAHRRGPAPTRPLGGGAPAGAADDRRLSRTIRRREVSTCTDTVTFGGGFGPPHRGFPGRREWAR